MAHATHEVHGDGTGAGFLSGVTLAIAAIVLAVVVAAIVLLVAQPWDDGDGNGITNNNNVPAVDESDAGGGVSEPDVVPDGQ